METGYCWQGDALILELRVQPRAGGDAWLGPQGGQFRVRIGAPPIDGQANARLCAFLAGLFQVPKSAVTLLSGAAGRSKRLRIEAPRRLPPGIAPPAAHPVAPRERTR